MAKRKEYIKNLTASHETLLKMQDVQLEAYDYINGDTSYENFITALGAFSTVLGLVFITSTPVGVAAGITGIITSISSSEKQTLLGLIDDGIRGIARLSKFLRENQEYDLLKANFPFLEFIIEEISFIQGEPELTAVHGSGGWWTI